MKKVCYAIVVAIVATILAVAIFATGAMYTIRNAEIWLDEDQDQMYLAVFDQVWVYDYYAE